ncbi:hypothetical protein [Dyella sp. 20L07]|uniref:hypothetical protein n=1 Tax=Dyella sp. 20L07 TaxID=3384240 RepID=UPI003D2BA902
MQPGDLAQMDYLRKLADRLRAAEHGRQGPLIDEAMSWLGVSRPTIYSRLRQLGWTSGRKLRADKGDSRLSEGEVKNLAAILRASQRQTGKELLPVSDAIDIAVSNGLIENRVAPATALRLMRRHDCHPRQMARPEPHTNLRSLHPNHVWQLDASVCVLYYLRNGKAQVMDERKFNVRKPRDLAKVSNQRLLRYALTDHATGDVIARYYNVSGEDQRTLFDFLMFAFHTQEGRVMHGVPSMLVWDAGSANESHAIKALLTALMIRHWTHIPGNPRAKGQVESVHNVIERKFEGRLSFTRIESVEDLNGHLDTWLKWFNGTQVHSRHRHTRDALWQTIRQDQLRLCPPRELCQVLLHSRPEPRVVKGNLTIQFTVRGYEPAVYSVEHVANARVGDTVMVAVNPYHAPSVFVIGENEDGGVRYWECEPIATDNHGFLVTAATIGEQFKAKQDTAVDTARKDVNEIAYGERDSLDATAARAKGRLAFDGAIDPFKDLREKAENIPAHMARRGTAMNVPNPVQVEVRALTFLELLAEIRAHLPRAITAEENAWLKERHSTGITEQEIPDIAAQISRGELRPVVTEKPRLRAVV